MFISYTYKKYIGYDEKTGYNSWEYELIDSEFGSISGTQIEMGWDSGSCEIVINEYEKRNLPVAPNLMKAILSFRNRSWTIDTIIASNRKYNPKFQKYEQELQKYLTLI